MRAGILSGGGDRSQRPTRLRIVFPPPPIRFRPTPESTRRPRLRWAGVSESFRRPRAGSARIDSGHRLCMKSFSALRTFACSTAWAQILAGDHILVGGVVRVTCGDKVKARTGRWVDFGERISRAPSDVEEIVGVAGKDDVEAVGQGVGRLNDLIGLAAGDDRVVPLEWCG